MKANAISPNNNDRQKVKTLECGEMDTPQLVTAIQITNSFVVLDLFTFKAIQSVCSPLSYFVVLVCQSDTSKLLHMIKAVVISLSDKEWIYTYTAAPKDCVILSGMDVPVSLFTAYKTTCTTYLTLRIIQKINRAMGEFQLTRQTGIAECLSLQNTAMAVH